MMNPAAAPLDASSIRNVIEKSIGFLDRKCIRLDGRDPNWRGLFSEQFEDITRAASPAEFESRVNTAIPERNGCRPYRTLFELASSDPTDDPAWKHLEHCHPCSMEFARLS
jgi:hypothetical protein